MPAFDRRATARRRAWGRGPMILRFEPLETRDLMAAKLAHVAVAKAALPDLIPQTLSLPTTMTFAQNFEATGSILNQGNAPTQSPSTVNIYASISPALGAKAFLLGQATIPAGIGPGGIGSYDVQLRMPPTALPGEVAGQPLYISAYADANDVIPESNKQNNFGTKTEVPVTIAPTLNATLSTTSFNLDQPQTTWGSTVNVTLQVVNNDDGASTPSRAKLVLTPSGDAIGGPNDVSVGALAIPPLASGQTYNLQAPITLPAVEPVDLGGSSNFTLSIVQDADNITNALYPHVASGGVGVDQQAIQVTFGTNSQVGPTLLPDLAPANVQTSSATLLWGEDVSVSTTVQNLGKADSGPVPVTFLLVGDAGAAGRAIFLGQTTVGNIPAGGSQVVSGTYQLPNHLPGGLTLDSNGTGKVVAVVNGENTINEMYYNNNTATSASVSLRLIAGYSMSTIPVANPASPQPAGSVSQVQGMSKAQKVAAAKYQASLAKKAKNEKTWNSIKHQADKVQDSLTNFFHKLGAGGTSTGQQAATPANAASVTATSPTTANGSIPAGTTAAAAAGL